MIVDSKDIETLCAVLHRSGKKIALTNGTFDIVHAGHVRYLKEAAKLADYLVVGVNSDSSVKRYKSDKRPIVPQAERLEVIDSLKPVDCAVLFEETTADALIAKVKPDVYVKGGDYTEETLPETASVKRCGGQIAFIRVVEGCSTTNIIRRVLEVYKK